MIGDDLRADVLAAQRAGLRAVLVRTGKGARFADHARAAEAAAILDSIADVPAWLDALGE
jgi:phosphoglycolate phosphatase-like HAD superfamily hydrolase